MQPFVCPECGRHSSFDPWAAGVCCPECGYTPAADEWTPKHPPKESKEGLRCLSCGRDLAELQAPYDMVPRCPYCRSTNLRYVQANSPPQKALLKGILLGAAVFVVVQLLLSWLDHSETLIRYPLVGALAALTAWLWYARRRQ